MMLRNIRVADNLIIVMFNLMPDDPLNHWGWGKGTM